MMDLKKYQQALAAVSNSLITWIETAEKAGKTNQSAIFHMFDFLYEERKICINHISNVITTCTQNASHTLKYICDDYLNVYFEHVKDFCQLEFNDFEFDGGAALSDYQKLLDGAIERIDRFLKACPDVPDSLQAYVIYHRKGFEFLKKYFRAQGLTKVC